MMCLLQQLESIEDYLPSPEKTSWLVKMCFKVEQDRSKTCFKILYKNLPHNERFTKTVSRQEWKNNGKAMFQIGCCFGATLPFQSHTLFSDWSTWWSANWPHEPSPHPPTWTVTRWTNMKHFDYALPIHIHKRAFHY